MRLFAKLLAIAFICAALWINTGIIYNQLFYVPDENDCANMSRSQAEFFGSLDLDTYEIKGHYTGNRTDHVWIEIEFLGMRIPWEATYLLPVSPAWIYDYDEVREKETG